MFLDNKIKQKARFAMLLSCCSMNWNDKTSRACFGSIYVEELEG